MQWILLAQEADPTLIGKIMLAGIAILTGINIFLSIYQKVNPKKAPGQEYVTMAALGEAKNDLISSIGSVRRRQESWEEQHNKKHEVLDEQHKTFVTRAELMTGRDTMFTALTQRLTEQGQAIHEISESVTRVLNSVNDVQVQQVKEFSKVWRKLDVMQERIRLVKEHRDEHEDGSDDNLPRT